MLNQRKRGNLLSLYTGKEAPSPVLSYTGEEIRNVKPRCIDQKGNKSVLKGSRVTGGGREKEEEEKGLSLSVRIPVYTHLRGP